MMSHIELMAVDLDGTLLTSDGEASAQSMVALRAAIKAGVQVVLTSARIYHSMLKYYKALDLDGPMICIDGAQIWGRPGALWQEVTFPRAVGLAIARAVDAKGDWGISTSVGDRTYYRRLPDQEPGEFKPGRWSVATNADTIPLDPLRIVTWDAAAAAVVRDVVERDYSDVCRLTTFYYEDRSIRSITVMSPAASKGAGIRFVAEKLGITPEHTLAIGDGHNDLSMFEFAGISVAMSNGLPEIREAADHVAPSNDDGGVAWAVEQFVL